MKVLGVESSIFAKGRNFSQPNFEARLYTSSDLTRYFNKKVSDKSLYIANIKTLSQKLRALPDVPVMVRLNKQASTMLAEGQKLPDEPAVEVHLGYPMWKDIVAIKSEVVPVDITSEPENFHEKIYRIACSLINNK